MKPTIDIIEAVTARDIAAVKELFLEYAAFLNVDLCFQNFDEEMETFPSTYDVLFLARVGSNDAAAIGLKDLGDQICEMKRLYARPHHQGIGLGGKLCDRLVVEARSRGFRIMRLDTLRRLEAAVALYKSRGFVEIGEYCDNPEEDVIYMELTL